MEYLTTRQLELQGEEVVVTASLAELERQLANLKRLGYLTRQHRIRLHGSACFHRIGGKLRHSSINEESQSESSSLRLL